MQATTAIVRLAAVTLLCSCAIYSGNVEAPERPQCTSDADCLAPTRCFTVENGASFDANEAIGFCDTDTNGNDVSDLFDHDWQPCSEGDHSPCFDTPPTASCSRILQVGTGSAATWACVTGAADDPCNETADCAQGLLCYAGKCSGNGCSSDPDCPTDTYCLFDSLGEGACSSRQDESACIEDAHCYGGICLGGRSKWSEIDERNICTSGKPGSPCLEDTPCTGGQAVCVGLLTENADIAEIGFCAQPGVGSPCRLVLKTAPADFYCDVRSSSYYLLEGYAGHEDCQAFVDDDLYCAPGPDCAGGLSLDKTRCMGTCQKVEDAETCIPFVPPPESAECTDGWSVGSSTKTQSYGCPKKVLCDAGTCVEAAE